MASEVHRLRQLGEEKGQLRRLWGSSAGKKRGSRRKALKPTLVRELPGE